MKKRVKRMEVYFDENELINIEEEGKKFFVSGSKDIAKNTVKAMLTFEYKEKTVSLTRSELLSIIEDHGKFLTSKYKNRTFKCDVDDLLDGIFGGY